MDIRKEFGGKLEQVLANLIDQNVGKLSTDFVAKELHDAIDSGAKSLHKNIDSLVEKHIGGGVEVVVAKLKEWVDLINGEKDLVATPAAPGEAPISPEPVAMSSQDIGKA